MSNPGKKYLFRGERRTVAEVAALLGVSRCNLYARIEGDTIREAQNAAPILLAHKGETLSLSEWSRRTGLPRSTVIYRYRQGWPVSRVLDLADQHAARRRKSTPNKTQREPRKDQRQLTLDGRTMTVAEWARELGLSSAAIIDQRLRAGWPLERALTPPEKSVRMLTFAGRTMGLSKWARLLGVGLSTLQSRLSHGWTVERTLTEPVASAGQRIRTRRNLGIIQRIATPTPAPSTGSPTTTTTTTTTTTATTGGASPTSAQTAGTGVGRQPRDLQSETTPCR